MNKKPLNSIGYGFVNPAYLPPGKDEYHLRNFQNRSGIRYRNLSAYEIEVLVRNRNTSSNWNDIQVSEAFNPELVKGCKFYGLVRIGKLEPFALEHNNLFVPVGLYDSTIISCDFGDNVVVNNVDFLSHYIIGNEVLLLNINELHVTDHTKFGNGIIKAGEDESLRVWLEVCNENGGRKILPFEGMLPGDAWLWSRHREDKLLQQKFKQFTEDKFPAQRGFYGKIGDQTVIKNTSIIKDCWIGSHAYIKGANKLKNLTINSSKEAPTQIGEGCEIVNGIIEYGCRIFYGVKAVRFFMASHSQLKYGARLINSYLGNNATISCCEVLNSLIFPAHEQHHNNSFLCAAVVMGQSNMAAGATIGSNHNSRAADGEILAGRGFWPGLCVSLKHNSRFATFTLIAKGDYPAELDIPLPFSLVSRDENTGALLVMPAYWPIYNMYALARNATKYVDRDKRIDKVQHIEYDFLAPDSVNEMMAGMKLLEGYVQDALNRNNTNVDSDAATAIEKNNGLLKNLEISTTGFENTGTPTVILKASEAWTAYRRLIIYYAVQQLMPLWENDAWKNLDAAAAGGSWSNVGGQLIPQPKLDTLLNDVRTGVIKSWYHLHHRYEQYGAEYATDKAAHALHCLQKLHGATLTQESFAGYCKEALATKEWMTDGIYTSRAKDYQSRFRSMLYNSEAEMNEVIGALKENVFINSQQQELEVFRKRVQPFLAVPA